MVESEIEDGKAATEIGAVRKFKVASGAIVREKLLAFSDADHLTSYSIIEPSGADHQPHGHAEARAASPMATAPSPIGPRASTRPPTRARLAKGMGENVFQGGFNALKSHFASA